MTLDDINSFDKQIGQLPIKLKRKLATAIAVEANKLVTAIKARDVTADPAIEEALTPDDLKADWPDCLN